MKHLIANWKSNKNASAAKSWVAAISQVEIPRETAVTVAPSFQLLSAVAEATNNSQIKLAAQDVSSYPMGSYTGAVNAQQLAVLGVGQAIVGHSERRRYFHETHQDVAAKIAQLTANNIAPILCLDEDYIEEQADALDTTNIKDLFIAYEPLAAIGTGNNAPADQVKRVIAQIKDTFGDVPVIYGGSVDERSIREYLLISDGVLVGSASLEAEQFAKLIKASQVD